MPWSRSVRRGGLCVSRVTAGSRRSGSRPKACCAQSGAVSISSSPVAAPQPNHKSDDDKVGAVAAESEMVSEKRSAEQGSHVDLGRIFSRNGPAGAHNYF